MGTDRQSCLPRNYSTLISSSTKHCDPRKDMQMNTGVKKTERKAEHRKTRAMKGGQE